VPEAKKLMLNQINDKELGYIVGLYLGDGYAHNDGYRHYRTEFSLNPKRDQDIKEYLITLLKQLGLNPYCIILRGYCLQVRINSKNLMSFLPQIAKEFLEGEQTNLCFEIGIISGLIDSDGWSNKLDTVITMKDPAILGKIEATLRGLGVYTRLWRQKIKKFRGDGTTYIWRLRVGNAFRKLPHVSIKIRRTVAKFN